MLKKELRKSKKQNKRSHKKHSENFKKYLKEVISGTKKIKKENEK